MKVLDLFIFTPNLPRFNKKILVIDYEPQVLASIR